MNITDNITYTCEDNIELMKRYPDNFFDLAIVDPPYGINAPNMKMGEHGGYKSTASKVKGRLNTSDCSWDSEVPSDEYFEELFRVSKNQIIWGGNYFDLPPTRGIIFWDKLQPWENFSQFELGWTSFDKPAAKIAISTTGGNNNEKKIHPTQKPIKLFQFCLDKYAKPGDKILDTNAGSASSLIACHLYGYKIYACEINELYYNDSIKRLQNYISQGLIEFPI